MPIAFEGPQGFGERPRGELPDPQSSSAVPSASKQEATQEIIEILGLPDGDFDLGDYGPGFGPEKYLGEAEEILDDLSNLRATLLHPYDDEHPEPLPDPLQSDNEDREYAQKYFGRAPPFLIDRLLVANRRRRENIHALRKEEGVKLAQSVEWNRKAIESSDAKASKATRKGPKRNRVRGYRRTTTPSGSEAGLSRNAPSTTAGRTSVFTQDIIHEHESVTSLSSSGGALLAPEPNEPPPPPVNIAHSQNLPFRCQYCTFEVPLELEKRAMTIDDWVAHFYLDLQPYTCTFEGCSRAQQLFGVKQEWFLHELDYHRATGQVWYCADCKTEHDDSGVFEEHLRASHPGMIAGKSPKFLEILINTCQRLSSQTLPQRECPLCGIPYRQKPTEWKDHIAHHLEQFALLAIGEEEDAPSSEDELNRDEFVSEYVEDLEETFKSVSVTVQEGQNTTVQPSLMPAESQDQRDLTETSGLGDSGGERLRRQTSDKLWADKVETYLSKQPEEDFEERGSLGSEDVTEETIWHEVPKRNDEFVGREHDLNRLNSFISHPGHICVISGRGGIGKTATAVEYARRFEHVYSSIIWIEAETPGNLDDQYSSIGTKIFSLGPESEQDRTSFSITVRGKLGDWDKRWLLIFDNVEAWKHIVRYIPRNLAKGKGSVLITTRQQSLISIDARALQQVLHRIELEPLTLEEAGQFLLCSIDKRVTPLDVPSHPDHALAVNIAGLVDRLPLALIMISGYVKVSRATLEDFLEIWDEKTKFRAKLSMRKDGKPRRYLSESGLDNSIDLLWDIGISELPNTARNLLEILAFLDPENIQKDLLVRDHDEPWLEFLNSTETALYQRMIRHLGGRKLIEVREREEEDGTKAESYKIHRLLQEKIIMELGAQLKFDSAMRKATQIVRKVFPRAPDIQAPAPSNWKACKHYMPHIFSLHRAFKAASDLFPRFQRTEELASLFYDAGFYIWDRQQSERDGLDFLDAAEDILDNVGIEPGSERRADIHCMAGLLCNTMGCQQRNESFRRLQMALDIRRSVYDTQPYDRTRDILLQNAATDYAILLLNRYEFAEAEVIFEKCLKRYCRWGTEQEIPFEYSKYYYNMGIVRILQQRLEEASRLLQRSVELAEAAFGKQSQYWANYFMLACSIRLNGDAQRALGMHLEIHKANLEQTGKHSKSTILSTFALGVMYGNIGDLPTAM